MSEASKKGVLILGILLLGGVLTSCIGGAQLGILTVVFEGMDVHVGQRFEARLFTQDGTTEIGRKSLGAIAAGSFQMEFSGVEEGRAYILEFYADVSGNDSYDPPPADAAWRITVTITAIPMSITFTRSDATTDIGWVASGPSPQQVDGVISDGEYPNSYVDPGTGLRAYWRNDQTTLTMGVVGPGAGWVAAGFDSTNVKEDANIIMGAVVGGQLVIEDQFGTGPFSHIRDTQQDVLESAAVESGGTTVLEFSIPLDSGDLQDKPLLPGGTYPLLLAYHSSLDDMTRKHSGAVMTQFTLDP